MAKELSIFVDESGDCGGKARYYLLTLVFHDQADSIAEAVRAMRPNSPRPTSQTSRSTPSPS